MKRAIAATTIVALFALPVKAHSVDEITEWEADWAARATQDITPELLAERIDFIGRHQWHYNPTPVARASSRSSTGTGSSDGVHRGMGSNVEQWRGLVEAHFAPDKVNMAMCIMAGESGGNPNAKNRNSTAAGLFQFLKSTWDNMVPSSVSGGSYNSGQVYDPEANVRAAAWLQSAAGWSQWSVYNRGRC